MTAGEPTAFARAAVAAASSGLFSSPFAPSGSGSNPSNDRLATKSEGGPAGSFAPLTPFPFPLSTSQAAKSSPAPASTLSNRSSASLTAALAAWIAADCSGVGQGIAGVGTASVKNEISPRSSTFAKNADRA